MDLKTLRTFLKLGARAQRDGIPDADVLRQEQTVLAALRSLDRRPGIVLADEVGMGKTYEALGIAAAVRRADRDARIVIVTPGPELNAKWTKDIAGFKEMHDFGAAQVRAARHLREFVEAARTSRIVVAPVTIFRTGRAQEERACILALYCRWKGLPHQTVHAVFRRVFPDGLPVPDLDGTPFLGAFGWEDLEAHLDTAFGCNDSSDRVGTLDALYTQENLEGFRNADAVRRGMYHARFALCAGLLPVISLLIVDEAHKLRNPGSLQTSAMRQVFERRFKKALLLTATPFQLDVGELREIFRLFSQATTAPPNLMNEIEDLLSNIRLYQQRYDLFQQTWMRLDPLQARAFSERYEAEGLSASFEDANLVLVLEHVKALHGLKTATIQPRLREWMIRSLRPEKRDYRQGVPQRVRASGAGVLPFLVYERFIAELFRQNRPTHKVAAEINMVSSYAAVAGSALMTANEALPASAEEYRALLRKILPVGKVVSSGHPKVSAVVADVLAAARVKEKTLVFCARTETIRQLQNEISHAWEAELVGRWRSVYPGAKATDIFDSTEDETRQRGRHSLLQARFHRPQDALYLALRESCLREPALAAWALKRLPALLSDANALLATQLASRSSAERVDHALASRCIRQAALRMWQQHHPQPTAVVDTSEAEAAYDAASQIDDGPKRAVPKWRITAPLARLVIGSDRSLWARHAAMLSQFPLTLRERLVERLARYLTSKQVPFLVDLLVYAGASGIKVDPVESLALLRAMPGFWRTRVGQDWVRRLGEFLAWVLNQTTEHQELILDDLDKTRSGGFVRHTLDTDSRERLRQLFNTPLFPMVLVANAVMQEGLDLHRQCRRVVHHDLEWNPAQVEQRIGRVDRLGSRTSRLREADPTQKLHILYPAICSTIDDRLYRTVKMREKWLEFLLGAQPQFEGFTFADDIPAALPSRLANELAIRLAPGSLTTMPISASSFD